VTDPVENHDKSRYPRLTISLLILILALIDLIILRVHNSFFWIYTAIFCIVAALLHIGITIYLNLGSTQQKKSIIRCVLYWVGILIAVYIVHLMLQHTIITSVEAGLFALLILALGFYFIGLMDDIPIMLVGITLALMVTGSIVIQAYLLLVIVPITIIMGILIYLLMKRTNDRNTI